MTTLDRYILRAMLFNYLIAIAVMMSLYVVLDLFFNIDEFARAGSLGQALADVGGFYGNRVFLYFSQLSGVITLFACLLTLARMRRMNELTAMLASGVSLYRVAVPVLIFGMLTTALWYGDCEMVIPRIAHKLARKHDDAQGLRTYGVWFLNDRDKALLSAQQYLPAEGSLQHLLIMNFDTDGAIASVVEAERATWEPTPEGPARGRWVLERGLARRRQTLAADSLGPTGEMGSTLVRYYDSDLDPQTIEMRQSAGWIRYLSTARLVELEQQLGGQMVEQISQERHTRFTTPLVNILLLLLGLPFILDRLPGNILADAGRCLIICGSCFVVNFIAQGVSTPASLSALPAWLPVIVFAPLAVILFDRIRT